MQIEFYRGERETLLPLLALADDSRSEIAGYMSLGQALVAREGERIIGLALIIEGDEAGRFELKSLAVAEDRQAEGIGRRLVETVIAHCRGQGGQLLTVSTAAADIANLRFYQRRGFRMARIVQDAFTPAKGYPEGVLVDGILLRDQVIFELKLAS